MTHSFTRRRLLASSGALLLAGVLPARAAGPETGQFSSRALPAPEAAMLARSIGPDVVLLTTANNAGRGIMQRALDFGTVMASTSNTLAIMERVGVAMRLEQEGSAPAADSSEQGRNIAGGYAGGDIDLRFNFDAWRYAFAVTQRGQDGGVTRSLQFFDEHGHALHKLYLRNEAAAGLFDMLALDFRAADQRPSQVSVTAPTHLEIKPDSAIDVRRFQQAWQAMAEPGQFNAIIGEFGLTREQALRLAPPGRAFRLAPQALRILLDGVVRQQLPVMALLGNAGVTQIYTGMLSGAVPDSAGYAVQAPGFRLHLQDKAIRSGYVVQRAGAMSVEFFGDEGEPVVTFVGLRDRARPQAWSDLVRDLPKA